MGYGKEMEGVIVLFSTFGGEVRVQQLMICAALCMSAEIDPASGSN